MPRKGDRTGSSTPGLACAPMPRAVISSIKQRADLDAGSPSARSHARLQPHARLAFNALSDNEGRHHRAGVGAHRGELVPTSPRDGLDYPALHPPRLPVPGAAAWAEGAWGEDDVAAVATFAHRDPATGLAGRSHDTRSSTAMFAAAPQRSTTMPYPVATPTRAFTWRSPARPISWVATSPTPSMPPPAPA
jgi:hypothetical protein